MKSPVLKMLPASFFTPLDGDYRIIFVGIEPESMDYADKPTCVVENAAYEFIDTLKGIL